MGLSLDTVTLEGQPYFGDTVVRDGTTVLVETDSLSFGSEIQRIGATDQRGEPATREVTLRMRSVSPELAESVQVGMTESNSGGTVARLTAVERSDATVVVRSDDGNVYERTHPVQEDVRFTAELSVRETAAGPTFKGAPIQQGSTVVLDLGTVTVEATVVTV